MWNTGGGSACRDTPVLGNLAQAAATHPVLGRGEAEVCDGLGVLERGVSARAPHAGPQQLGLLRAAAEGDPHLPRQPLPRVHGAEQVVSPESTCSISNIPSAHVIQTQYHCYL